MSSKRVGGHVSRDTITRTLGFEPEVGETFVAGDMTLRVLSRTIGLEFDDEGTEMWFDRLFIVTVEAVDDVEAAGAALRGMFGDPDAEADERTPEAAMADGDGPAEDAGEDGDGDGERSLDLDEDVRRDIEALLGDL